MLSTLTELLQQPFEEKLSYGATTCQSETIDPNSMQFGQCYCTEHGVVGTHSQRIYRTSFAISDTVTPGFMTTGNVTHATARHASAATAAAG